VPSIASLAALLAALAAPGSAAAVVPARAPREVSFDEGWRFLRGNASGAARVDFDDSSWRTVDLPHDWSIENLPPGDPAKRSGCPT
jgi:beta-galactosidase